MQPRIVINIPADADTRTVAMAEMLVASSTRIGAIFGVDGNQISVATNGRVTKSMLVTLRRLFSRAVISRDWEADDDAVFGYGYGE